MFNVLVLLMGEGQETSERPASFHKHRAVWLILNGLIQSPSKPSIEIIMYSILRNIRTSNNDKYQSSKMACTKSLDILSYQFYVGLKSFTVQSEAS